jgi:hypothetical protein
MHYARKAREARKTRKDLIPDESTAFLAFLAFHEFLAIDRPYAPCSMLFALKKSGAEAPLQSSH